VIGALAKMRTPALKISRHKLHDQFAQSGTRSVSNPMQQFSSHGAVARFCATALIGWKPYPLSGQGFYGSPIARRKLRGVPRDGHAIAAQQPARQPSKYLASCPRNLPAMTGQWQRQCRRVSVKTACKPTRLAPDANAPCPCRKLARRLASNLNHDIQRL
jgi:hypothetical protein